MIECYRDCLVVAAGTWITWRDNLEDDCAKFCDLPILKDQRRFSKFCASYSIYRGASVNGNQHLRVAARAALSELENPDNAEKLARDLELKTDTTGRRRKDVSAASKFLWLWQPRRFTPWDSFARKGMLKEYGSDNTLTGKLASTASYNKLFNERFDDWKHREEITEIAKSIAIAKDVEALSRMAFDVWLMWRGGRWQ